MPDTPVQASNGKFNVGGSRDVDLEDIDPNQYNVFTTDKNLAAARKAYPKYDWFACFTVKDKRGNDANIRYTVTFNKPASGTLYYFYNGTAVEVGYDDAPNKGNQQRSKATLTVGDPPIGMT